MQEIRAEPLKSGKELTELDLKLRLQKMGIKVDNISTDKTSFADLYNKSIVDIDNRNKIMNFLRTDAFEKTLKVNNNPTILKTSERSEINEDFGKKTKFDKNIDYSINIDSEINHDLYMNGIKIDLTDKNKLKDKIMDQLFTFPMKDKNQIIKAPSKIIAYNTSNVKNKIIETDNNEILFEENKIKKIKFSGLNKNAPKEIVLTQEYIINSQNFTIFNFKKFHNNDKIRLITIYCLIGNFIVLLLYLKKLDKFKNIDLKVLFIVVLLFPLLICGISSYLNYKNIPKIIYEEIKEMLFSIKENNEENYLIEENIINLFSAKYDINLFHFKNRILKKIIDLVNEEGKIWISDRNNQYIWRLN